jgi:hypothetical protein
MKQKKKTKERCQDTKKDREGGGGTEEQWKKW